MRAIINMIIQMEFFLRHHNQDANKIVVKQNYVDIWLT